jgi:alkylated DNA repair dioxygenase AlkB
MSGQSLSSQGAFFDEPTTQRIDLPGADIVLHQQVWSPERGNQLCNQLVQEIEWRQDKISMFGQVHDVPRLNAWYGDPDCSYAWSGIRMHPFAWTPTLQQIREQVNSLAAVQFNSALLNLYRDGNDKVDWHADDEQVLGLTPVIASASFGASRKFRLRRKDRSLKATDIVLDSGDVLIMRGSTQQLWEHEVPRSKKVKEPRVNLTFRKVRVAA